MFWIYLTKIIINYNIFYLKIEKNIEKKNNIKIQKSLRENIYQNIIMNFHKYLYMMQIMIKIS